MSKSVLDKIQNPDVPGFENLPKSPPPPLPVKQEPDPQVANILNGNNSETLVNTVNSTNMQNLPIDTNIQHLDPMLVNYQITPVAPYFIAPQPPPPPPPPPPLETSQHQINTSWWLPTPAAQAATLPVGMNSVNSTNIDGNNIYQQWYDPSYGNALIPGQDQDAALKAKAKFFHNNKRKNEVIDPKADAEKVAAAQRELAALMSPLKCDLCNAVMNSGLQAKLHYDGKPHQKKVSMFLNQSVKKLKTEAGQVTATTNNDPNTYCEVCKTWFTSLTDASQHYAGKKHMKAAFGGHRKQIKRVNLNSPINKAPDPLIPYGMGMAYPAESQVPIPNMQPPPLIPQNLIDNPGALPAPLSNFTEMTFPLKCELCDVYVNRPDQLDFHKKGAKHTRMLKARGLPVNEEECVVMPVENVKIDYSIHRTPSGQYYCAPCNMSLNSETMFAQHLDSKRHRNTINPIKTQQTTTLKKSSKKKFKK